MNGRISLGGNDVVYSGSFVAASRQAIEMWPIPDDPDFRIAIRIVIADTDKSQTRTIVDETDHTIIEISRPWNANYFGGNDGIAIGQDDEYEYKLNYTMRIVGKPEEYLATFSFAIIREPIA